MNNKQWLILIDTFKQTNYQFECSHFNLKFLDKYNESDEKLAQNLANLYKALNELTITLIKLDLK